MFSDQDVVIRVNNLSKCYEIYDKPSDRLKRFFLPRLRRLLGQSTKHYFREFWALKDVSFEIKKGETVGIIGRNGSGKSTLLQLICGTLTPTSGTVETSGRIAALLELGSGFNPEFTGRENVYMNAAVLGLSHKEVEARFDDIVAFADIGDFIDQAVKTYSSGMYVRLAFAVIAHVDADILIVDEALSVGDAIFAQKCMRFIRAFQEKGSLIFVSHDAGAVQNLCKSGIWLKNGKIEATGTSKSVSETYLQFTLQEVYGEKRTLTSMSSEAADRQEEQISVEECSVVTDYSGIVTIRNNIAQAKGWKTGSAEIVSLAFEKASGESCATFEGGEKIKLSILAKANEDLLNPILGFTVRDRLGQELFGENTLGITTVISCPVKKNEQFRGEFVFRLPMLPNGQYVVMASVADGSLHENIQHHFMHDGLVLNVTSSKVRYGLVGIPFESVQIKVDNE